MTALPQIHGAKGGSKPHTPVEADDSVRSIAYAKMVLALGEGEFAGGIDGRDIYLDGTPLIGENGETAFGGVSWEVRYGTPDQPYIQGMPNVENEVGVGVEVEQPSPWVRSVSNLQLSAVRIRLSWPTLMETKDNGDRVGTKVAYAIELSTDGGPWEVVVNGRLNDKTTTKYERSHRVDLPPAEAGWQVRVRRITPDSTSTSVINAMRVEAISEVIDAKLRYPNTALLFIQFDASQFQSIPLVAVKARGRVVRVPSNYDAATRTYSGLWDGTFKWSWTDNPAWVIYDLFVTGRFGLGRRINPAMVDKWVLYQIAQYCDQLVPDGQGGQEPRFTCNVYIQTEADAWQVLRDIAAIFRGMTYWANSMMVTQADMPRDIDYLYTRANVIEGRFEYAGGSSQRDRYSMALVSWDNPANQYDTEVEPVSDQALMRRYGLNKVELTAIGCTKRSEAQRRGKWTLLTNSHDRTVSFRVGLDGQIPLPGYIIGVADELLAGRPLGGRISSVDGVEITLDREAQAQPGDRLIVNLPDGTAEARTVQASGGRVVTVSTPYSVAPATESIWTIDAEDLAIQQFRVTGITQPEDGQFEISAVAHDPNKFARVDTGARVEPPPITVLPPGAMPPPAEVSISEYQTVDQGINVNAMRVEWPAVQDAVAYIAEWRRDDGPWISVPRTSALGFDVVGIYAGRYVARVRAVSVMDVKSLPATSVETVLQGKTQPPPVPAFLNTTGIVFGIRLDWGFPAAATDTLKTEVQYGQSSNPEDMIPLGDFAYPVNTHTLLDLAAGAQLYFRARLIDKTGNVGEWTDIIPGQASSSATKILDYLAGKIGETELTEGLLERIEDVEQLGFVVYDPEAEYTRGNVVFAGGGLYQWIAEEPGNVEPPDDDYWQDIGEGVITANGLAIRVDQAEQQIGEIDGRMTAVSPAVNAIESAWRDDDGEGELEGALNAWDARAAIRVESTTRASELGAFAQQLTTVQATANNASAAVQETMEAVNEIGEDLSASWGIRTEITVDGVPYMSGIAVGVTEHEGEVIRDVTVATGRFSVIDEVDGSVVAPFVVVNGQVIMNTAVIGNATINSAKLSDWLESDAIGPGGDPVLRMNFRSGEFAINAALPGSGRMTINNRAVKVFDENDTLRVQLGDLDA